MRAKLIVKPFPIALGVALWLALLCAPVCAQCAMCRAAAAASGAASSWNAAILVLLIPPVTVFCAIFIVAFRLRAAPAETPRRETQKENQTRRTRLEKPDTGAGRKDRRSDGHGLAGAT